MKKLTILLTVVSVVFFVACGGGGETKKSDDTKAAKNEVTKKEAPVKDAITADFSAGEAIYNGKGTCVTCHQKTGLGLPPTFPPLAKADYLLANKNRAIAQTMYGAKEPITVNGTEYPGGIMTVPELTDQEVMDVVNYILNSWGNNAGTVTLEDVAAQRK